MKAIAILIALLATLTLQFPIGGSCKFNWNMKYDQAYCGSADKEKLICEGGACKGTLKNNMCGSDSTKCSAGFYCHATFKVCAPCSLNCISCTDAATCTGCKAGFWVTTTKVCDSGPANCAYPTSKTECTTCNLGYYLNTEASPATCDASTIANCNRTSSKTVCSWCNNGFYWDSASTSCKATVSFCYQGSSEKSCMENYCYPFYYTNTWAATDYTCEGPVNNCDLIQRPGYCTACLDGYFLTSSPTWQYCYKVTYTTGCKTPSGSENLCGVCLDEYMLWPYCYPPISNCAVAKDATKCATAAEGYALNTAGTPTSCGFGGKKCTITDTATTISECKAGFYLSGKTCIFCGWNVGQCSINSQHATAPKTVALTCLANYQLSQRGTCVSCGTSATTCTVTSTTSTDTVTITGCASGYVLDTTCKACTGAGAATCDKDTTTILTCKSGYKKYTDTGTTKAVCKDCTTGSVSCTVNAASPYAITTVDSCITGLDTGTNYYKMDTSGCQACAAGAKTCSVVIKALTCKKGYYLKSDACTACPTNSVSCTAASGTVNGVTCKDGYGTKSGAFECLACGATPNKYKSCTVKADGVSVDTAATVTCYAPAYCTISTGFDCMAPASGGPVDANAISCKLVVTTNALDTITCNAAGFYTAKQADAKACVSFASWAGCARTLKCTAKAGDADGTDAAAADADCKSGNYYKDATDFCKACSTIANGATCSGATGVLATCASGWAVDKTVASPYACKASTDALVVATDATGVVTCVEGYSVNTLKTGCFDCGSASNMATCQYTTGKSETCQAGYHKSTINTCCLCGTGILDCNLQDGGCSLTASSPVISCKDGYKATSTNSGCVACQTNAKYCTLNTDQTAAASIVECNEGYIKKVDTTTTPGTTIETCEKCGDGVSTCTYVTYKDCDTGYYLGTDNTCNACGNGAKSCTSNTVAKECNTGFVFDSATTSCKDCNSGYSYVATCTATATTVTPTSCIDTYFLETVTVAGVSKLQCTSCKSGEVGAYVKKCTANTGIKNGSPVISDCVAGSFKINYCFKGISYCLTPSTPTTCKVCKEGYYVNSDNTCSSCGTGAKKCTYGTTGVVISECLQGYYKTVATTGAVTCDSCGASCDVCGTATTCKTCLAGFYLTSDTPPACQGCGSGVATCTAPAAGASTPNIGTCQEGYYLATSGTTSSCTACTEANCKTCGGDKCSACKDGYYLGGIKCYQGPSSCKTCNQVAKCSGCSVGYYWDEPTLTCKTCTAANCKACSSATACSACITGYYNKDGNCTACPFSNLTNCVSCSAADVCDICIDAYYWDTTAKACKNCTTGCAICGEAATCYECNAGYYRDLTNKCTACIKGCQVCADAVNCTTCFPGYIKDAAKGTCSSCHASCATCTSTAENGCATCPTNSTITSKTINGVAGQVCACNSGFSFDTTLGKCVAGTSGASYLFCGFLSLLVILLAIF